MKIINLKHKSLVVAKRSMEKHGKDCKLDARKDVYFIECHCKDIEKVKKTKKEFIKEIDADGNGHITHKEVEDYFGKDDK